MDAPGIIFLHIVKNFMKNYLLSALLVAGIASFSCNNPDKPVVTNTDSVAGNTDSTGSQPVQPGPGSANAGNATDTLSRDNDQKLRTDSVIRH